MREWVCHLQLLLALTSAVILGSKCHGTHDHIVLSQIRESPNLEGQFPAFISHMNRVTQFIPPGTVFPFCCLLQLTWLRWRYSNWSPHRSLAQKSNSKSKLLYDCRFTANQIVLESSPLRLTTRDLFFSTEPLR
jgi:hypothetical protein